MNNKQQASGMGVVVVSQSAIVLLGVAGIWLLNISLPAAKIGGGLASIFGVFLAVITFAIFFLVYRFGGRFAQTLLTDLQRVWGLFTGYSWLKIIVVASLAGIGEELLFRGFAQTWLNSSVTNAWEIFISSIIFALLHYFSYA